ncbi:HtaA domain-containing protein [Streptomyces sp. NBC_00872]|uniref:HtaA domain-containing protein n=1 Tax=Streptomyces sp. NBC_00872 TaxID=2903686 RepID=UPI00386C0537|nr:HtaA domain-containing protein [Streptomyces sp. NBC_00872]
MLSFRPVRAFGVALLLALPVTLLPAVGAQAASRTVQGGRLDWGIKSSFLSYVTGPIARGGWALTGGAATVGSRFRFHSATGSYDPATGAFRAGFSGGVRFTGHQKTDGTYELDLTISRPTVRISGGGGTVYADMTSKAKGSGKLTRAAQVPLASLDLSGISMVGGGSPVALDNVPATLTSQGATAFAGYYTAGTPLDPVSLSVDVAAGKPAGPSTGGPTTAPTTGPTEKKPEKKPEEGRASGRFSTAAVDWGVRRTYREYVTGPIAKGTWTLSDGAQDGGALFRFPRGTGSYDAGKGTLDADFAGTVRFTGTGLDLTLTGIAVRVKDGKGTLLADVTDAAEGGPPRQAVPLVTFEAEDFTPKKGLASLTEVPATLTAPGAETFGSLYKAGTAMDPVSLAVAVDGKARLPALPDLGSGASAAAEPTAPDTAAPDPTGPAAEATSSAASSSSTGAGTYTALGAGALVVAGLAVLGVVLVRRRGGAATSDER